MGLCWTSGACNRCRGRATADCRTATRVVVDVWAEQLKWGYVGPLARAAAVALRFHL